MLGAPAEWDRSGGSGSIVSCLEVTIRSSLEGALRSMTTSMSVDPWIVIVSATRPAPREYISGVARPFDPHNSRVWGALL